jgi:hypothetical protein
MNCTILDLYSIENSNSTDRLALAIVSDVYSQTVVGYHLATEQQHEVEIAALLHAVVRKNYPSQYGSSALWTTGDSPQFLLTDSGNELTNNLTSLAHFFETRKIQPLKLGVGRDLSFTGSTERMLQSLSVNLLKHQSVWRHANFPLQTIPLRYEELKNLLEGYIVRHNHSICPRDRSRTRHQVWLSGLHDNSSLERYKS